MCFKGRQTCPGSDQLPSLCRAGLNPHISPVPVQFGIALLLALGCQTARVWDEIWVSDVLNAGLV